MAKKNIKVEFKKINLVTVNMKVIDRVSRVKPENLVATNSPTDTALVSYDEATGKFKWTSESGVGDMLKLTYDTDDDGIVDKAESLDDGAGNTASASNTKDAITKKHTHSNKATLDLIEEALTSVLKVAYDDAVSKEHEHSNKATLDLIEEAFTSALKTAYDSCVTNEHTHSNKATLDNIEEAFTTALKTAYDSCVTNEHTHSNKAILDSIQEALTTALKSAYDDAVNKSHTQNTDTKLDEGGGNEVAVANIKDAVDKKHTQNSDTQLNNLFNVDGSGGLDWINGNIIYVPIAGSIEAYHDAATAGDTLILASGTYTITDDIDITKAINIVGQGVGKTIIVCNTGSKRIFHIDADNVRIANMTLSVTVSSCADIHVEHNHTGLLFENLKCLATQSGSAGITAIRVDGSSATFRNIIYIGTGDRFAKGLMVYNNNETDNDIVVNCYNMDILADNDGGASGRINTGIEVYNNNNANSITLNLYNCKVVATEATGSVNPNVAIELTSVTTTNAIVNAYGCTFDGFNYDISNDDSNTITLYDTVLVNALISGTVLYDGTLGTKDIHVSGNVTDGTNASSPANIKDAVTKKHTRSHAIDGSSDHSSSITEDNIITGDGNGLPKDSGADISTDGTLGDDSDNSVPTEKAVKTYADTKAVKHITINTQTDDYVLVLGDDGKLVDMNKGTAVTLTVPSNASVAFPIGTTIAIRQKGAGQVTISPVTGVTVDSQDGLITTAQHAMASILKVDTDVWVAVGSLETA